MCKERLLPCSKIDDNSKLIDPQHKHKETAKTHRGPSGQSNIVLFSLPVNTFDARFERRMRMESTRLTRVWRSIKVITCWVSLVYWSLQPWDAFQRRISRARRNLIIIGWDLPLIVQHYAMIPCFKLERLFGYWNSRFAPETPISEFGSLYPTEAFHKRISRENLIQLY